MTRLLLVTAKRWLKIEADIWIHQQVHGCLQLWPTLIADTVVEVDAVIARMNAAEMCLPNGAQ